MVGLQEKKIDEMSQGKPVTHATKGSTDFTHPYVQDFHSGSLVDD